jgi:hypothetical protein
MPQTRSNILTVLTAVKAKLLADEVLGVDATEDRVRLINKQPDRVPTTMGDKLLFLRPRRENPAGKFDGGSGRIDRRTYRLVEISILSRYGELDQIDDKTHLLDEDLSHFELEDDIIDCLDLHHLADPDENLILFEPMRWVQGPSDPETFKPGWIISTIQFEVGYQRDLTQ